MKSVRIVLVLGLLAAGCDSASSEAASNDVAKADASGSKSTPAAAKSTPPPKVELPAGAEAQAKSLMSSYSKNDGFSGEYAAKDLDAFLWQAANNDDDLVVESALQQAVDLVHGMDDEAFINARKQLTAVALSKLDAKGIEAFYAAVGALEPALTASTVDPAVASAIDGLLREGTSVERKVIAADALGQINADARTALALTKIALASPEEAVVASALARTRGRHDGMTALTAPFLTHANPVYVAGAIDVLAESPDAKTPAGKATLLEHIGAGDPYVRAVALKSYARAAGKDAAPEIAKLLDDTTAIEDRRVRYDIEGGGSQKAGVSAFDSTLQRAALTAVSHADSAAYAKFPRVDWNDPASVKATLAAAKAWTKEHA